MADPITVNGWSVYIRIKYVSKRKRRYINVLWRSGKVEQKDNKHFPLNTDCYENIEGTLLDLGERYPLGVTVTPIGVTVTLCSESREDRSCINCLPRKSECGT